MPFSVKDRKATIALLQEDLQTCSDEERKQKIHSIQMLYALEKFHDKSYSQAMTEFLRLNVDPSEVIKLFPQLHRYTGKKWNINKEKQNAIFYLIWYLKKLQVRLKGNKICETSDSKESDKQEWAKQRMEMINTTLLKLYLLTNNDSVLYHIQNHDCYLEVAEKLLRRHSKFHELLILYKKKGLHSKALQYLKAEAKKQEHCHYRFDGIKKYLQDLGAEHINVIIQFSDWILKENPYEGLAIFTEVIIDAEKLPRTKILDYLISENKQLAIPYLEHVIHKWKDTTPMFHETLIKFYIEQIIAKQTNSSVREKNELHYRLLIFLEESRYYDPERVLMNIPKDGFLEERAILYGKLGKYEDGLTIYVFLLEDLDKAILYCEKMYNTKDARNIYLNLIQLLLKKLKQGASETIHSILDILENNANKISAIDVLPELPDSVPLDKLRNFLNYTFEAQFATKQEIQIYKSLSYVEYLQMPELKRNVEAKSFEVTVKMTCSICKKPFGNKQRPFFRYPDGEIVHILCNNKLQTEDN